MTLALPLQYAELPSINNVKQLNRDDMPCFKEIQHVLKKHGKDTRFGLCLLHNHFNLAEDEVLAETSNEETRTLIIRPIKASQVGNGKTIETVWRMDTGKAQLCCHKHGSNENETIV